MSKRRDIVDIDGIRSGPAEADSTKTARPFLSIWYRCCHVYGRLYRNRTNCAYEGSCPACRRQARVGIGPEGHATRVFEAC